MRLSKSLPGYYAEQNLPNSEHSPNWRARRSDRKDLLGHAKAIEIVVKADEREKGPADSPRKMKKSYVLALAWCD